MSSKFLSTGHWQPLHNQLQDGSGADLSASGAPAGSSCCILRLACMPSGGGWCCQWIAWLLGIEEVAVAGESGFTVRLLPLHLVARQHHMPACPHS